MNNSNYRHSLTHAFTRHLIQGTMNRLMPGGSGSASSALHRSPSPEQHPTPVQGRSGRVIPANDSEYAHTQASTLAALRLGMPIASFNAPAPAPQSAATFSYPPLLDKSSIDALPESMGVYIFRGENDIPLYVGRSVNLRSRVLAHLHNPDEAILQRQSRRVEFRRAAGELGAMLMESQLIRQIRPLHNKKQRPRRELYTLRMSGGQPQAVQVNDDDFSRVANLYGVFGSMRAAQEAMQALVDQHGLCSIVTGLEQGEHGMACFGRQIRRCHGACTGEESHESHQQRLQVALEDLRILQWPYQGAMGIVEECGGWRQVHVIDHWRYVGTIDDDHPYLPQPDARQLKQGFGNFDLDCYKTIIKPFLLQTLNIQPIGLPVFSPVLQ